MSLFGSVFGDSKDADPGKAPKQMARLSQQLVREASPVRRQLLNRSKQFLSGGLDVTQSPMYASLKNAVDTQYGQARDNVLASTPAGGRLTQAIVDLEGNRAGQMVSGIGGIAENELNRALTLGTGQTGQGLSGFGSAAGNLGNIGLAQAQQQAGALQGAGYAAGQYLGSKGAGAAGSAASSGMSAGAKAAMGACWVAEVLYGIDDKRTKAIRNYVLDHMQDKSVLGVFCRLYSKRGKSWAKIVKKNKVARYFALKIWNRLLVKANGRA